MPAMRDPVDVMSLPRLGASHPTRLSFLRILLRRMRAEGWRYARTEWAIRDDLTGHAVLTLRLGARAYSLVAFAHDLPPEDRSDRVIATAWDATFALFDGVPTRADIARLSRNVPLQEAGRLTARELTLSRANRSVRLWDRVVDALSRGRQPDPAALAEVGYLMRTTAVYGSGKFGAADRCDYADRPELSAPFQAEMMTVWLIRQFVADLVNHAARVRAPAMAVPLDDALRRSLGIGNSTGLGMAPFLMNHPALLHAWVAARETALARIRALPRLTAADLTALRAHTRDARAQAEAWRSADPVQAPKVARLREDLAALADHLATLTPSDGGWDALWAWGARLSLEGQERLLAILMEPNGPLIDDLAAALCCDEGADRIDPAQSCATLRRDIARTCPGALSTDWSDPAATARVWYTSEEKLEPRLGPRDGLQPWEQPLGAARALAELHDALAGATGPLGPWLADHPEHRHAVRRAQRAARLAYAEVQGNVLASDLLPIDLLRAKLAFFGARAFDPRSDRWLRISLFADAPMADEFA
ncbi:MAG: hypothetical protein ACU0BF_07090 [Paracoccaceae bacterium]